MKQTTLTLILATLLAFCPAPPADAGEANFEISAGAYVSGNTGFVGESGALGIRGGYRFTDRWAIQGSLSHVELFDFVAPVVDVDGDATFFDVSAMFFVNPRSKAEFFIYGGIGMAQVDVDYGRIRYDAHGHRTHNPGFGFRVHDDFTRHFGFGLNIRLSEKMYLRPDVRSRWLGSVENGVVDGEASLGLGWKF